MEYKITAGPDQDTVHLEGHVNETAVPAFVRLERQLKAPSVVFNLRGVISFNSMGAMEWMSLVARLAQTRRVQYEECGPAFVDLANLIPSFAEAHRVASLLVPYACAACGGRRAHVLTSDKAKGLARFATAACPQCGGEENAEVSVEDYLLFLRA